MQILPDNIWDLAGLGLNARSGADAHHAGTAHAEFARELDKSLRSAESSSDDNGEKAYLLVDAPYNPTPEVLSPFEPQPARLTPAEVEQLVTRLHDDGVPPAALNAIAELAGTPGGPTMDMIVLAARRALEGDNTALSAEENTLLGSFSRKVAGDQGDALLKLLQSSPRDAMKSIMEKLKGGPEAIGVSREEIGALAKALKLPPEAGRNLLQAFGDKPLLSLDAPALRALLEPAKLALDKSATDMDKLLAGLQKHGPAILRDAAKREEIERLASTREDRSVAQSRLLIADTATQAAPGRADNPEQGKQTRAVSRRAEATPTEQALQQANAAPAMSGETSGRNASAHNGRDGREPGTDPQAEKGRDALLASRSNAAGRNAAEQPQASPRTAASANTAQPVATPLTATLAQGVDTLLPQAGKTAASNLSRQALDQIEQAVLTASRNGTQRLEVALKPVELGAMTVVLTSRNGEISALIQPDKAETAALITQQAERIRAELENQGFRVEKVEVQTQLADQNGQNWQGAQQHNASRDMQARVLDLERLRRLGRESRESSDSAQGLAHDMQIQSHTATLAGQGLHLIA